MKNNNEYSLLGVLTVIYRWRMLLLKTIGAGIVAMVVISFLLPVFYTSSVTFVPTDEDDKERLYGQEDANSRVILLAGSSSLVHHMVEKFDLYSRYDIDVSNSKAPHYVKKAFFKRFNVEKNPYAGIQVSIEDKDPAFAAEMLREFLNKLQQMYQNVTIESKKKIVDNFETELHLRRKKLQNVSDTLTKIREFYNIYDVENQAEVLSNLIVNTEFELLEARAKLSMFQAQSTPRDSFRAVRNKISTAEIKLTSLKEKPLDNSTSAVNLANFNEGKDQVIYFEKMFEYLHNEISTLTEEYAEFRSNTFANIAELIILEPVEVPTVKSYPVRWIIVIFGTIAVSVFAVLGILILEFSKKVDWTEIFSDNAG